MLVKSTALMSYYLEDEPAKHEQIEQDSNTN
jgi:hypothetical protein